MFLEIFGKTWPTILISMVILVSMRVLFIVKNKEKVILYRELITLFFIVYVLCLFYVVTFQDVNFNTSNFNLFHEMFRYEIGSRLFIKNTLGNLLLFMPYGFFVAYYLKTKKPYVIFFLSFVVSITIEVTQSLIGRVFDIDDIVLNVIGGMMGYYLYLFLNKINDNLPVLLKKPLIYNIIIICLLGLFIVYLMGFNGIGE